MMQKKSGLQKYLAVVHEEKNTKLKTLVWLKTISSKVWKQAKFQNVIQTWVTEHTAFRRAYLFIIIIPFSFFQGKAGSYSKRYHKLLETSS